MLGLVFSKKKCDWSPVVATSLDVELEALMVQGEVFTCLFVVVVVVVVIVVVVIVVIAWHFNFGMIYLYLVMRCVWLVACVFKFLGKDNKVDSSAAMFVTFLSIPNIKSKSLSANLALYAVFWVIPPRLLPRRKHTTFRTRRKFEIKKNSSLTTLLFGNYI